MGCKYRGLWNASYLSISCIIVNCRSFLILTKALFVLIDNFKTRDNETANLKELKTSMVTVYYSVTIIFFWV